MAVLKFKARIHPGSLRYIKMEKWLTRIYQPPAAKCWAFLDDFGDGVSDVGLNGFNKIVFLYSEDALAFKLEFSECIEDDDYASN